jgi:hypothetical protein
MTKPRSLALATLALAAALPFAEGGCATLAIATAPEKQAVIDDSAPTKAAERAFWTALHGGKYESIGETLELYQQSYLANPNAAMSAARIGWLHTWRLAERARLASPPATITDDIVLGRKYFGEAVALSPHESRFQGFSASLIMAEGTVHKDEALTRRGYFQMNDAVAAWPEFNLFTAGISVANLPVEDPLFREGVERQWQNLDVCVDGKVDRADGRFDEYMAMETHSGWNRACWDSWIAPHNLEGFFLHMGDMLVKTGDIAQAKVMYENAKLPKNYATWKLRDVLEDRLAHASEYTAPFREKNGAGVADATKRPFWASSFTCTGCHQD